MFCPEAPIWGDIGTWVGAIGTSIAALGTFMALFWAVWQFVSLRKHEQARNVYGFIDYEVDDPSEAQPTPESPAVSVRPRLTLRVGNGSGLPVYNCFFYYLVSQEVPEISKWEKVERLIEKYQSDAGQVYRGGPIGTVERSTVEDVPIVQVLPPGDFRVLKDIHHVRGSGHEAVRSDLSRKHGLDLVFTDAAGRRWTRRANGKLKKARTDPMDRARFKSARERSFGGLPFVNILPLSGD